MNEERGAEGQKQSRIRRSIAEDKRAVKAQTWRGQQAAPTICSPPTLLYQTMFDSNTNRRRTR